jgi:hypothetical protein
VRCPLSPPDLSQEDVTLAAQRSQVLFQGPHALPDGADSPL